HGCVETAEAHQSLEPHLAGRVDEDQPVKVLHHPALEEERNVADDDSVAAVAGIGYETVAEGVDRGVHDPVELLQLVLIAEDDVAELLPIQRPVGSEYR